MKILILGAGGLAADLADMIEDADGLEFCGFIEGLDANLGHAEAGDRPVYWIEEAYDLVLDHKVIAGIGDPRRAGSIQRLTEMGFEFITFVHPSAQVARSASVGIGSVVGPGAILAAGATVSDHVYVNRGALIGHHTTINEFCTVGPGANLAAHCDVGKSTFIGIGATVIDRILIGERSFVAGGAVVVKHLPEASRVAGVPAKPLAKVVREAKTGALAEQQSA